MGKGSVFLLGPGFIGLGVLKELLHEGYQVTILVRKEEARAGLEKLGTKTILGSLDDGDIICSVITDKSNGAYASDKIYEDDKPETIDSVADDAPHRTIDLAILKRRAELGAKAKIAIMFPPLIYGLGQENRLSIQLPTMARFALKHGYAGYVGKGKALWRHIHVADLARGYMTILHHMESSSGEEVLKNPYFFSENGEDYSWEACAEMIGKALKQAGKIEDSTPREIPEELYGDLFKEWSVPVIGQNARNRANRLRALGWEPREKSTFDSLMSDELPLLLAETGEFNGYAAAVAS